MNKATVVTYPDEFAVDEIKELAKAAGYSVEGLITQKQIVKSEYGVGVGKADELREIIAQNGSKTIIIDEELSSKQAHNLAKVTEAEVVDRNRLILNIFARRAVTAEAKLQVQLAELHYEFPRAKDAVRYSVTGERAGFSGMGESAVDVKFRALKRRMNFLKERLDEAQSHRQIQRSQRRKLDIPFVSLAGYTSSGKTTLFNRFASEAKEESPDLFTTLTTTTRAVSFGERNRKVLLSDTVGFISRIPTYMVESFKSTLEELTFADLILLMLDSSEAEQAMRIKLTSSRETLTQLGVDFSKVLLILNKIDMAKDLSSKAGAWSDLFDESAVLRVSAVRGDGLRQLKNKIMSLTFPQVRRQPPVTG